MKNLSCRTIRASFSDYLDGAVSGRQMQQISRHINGFDNAVDHSAESSDQASGGSNPISSARVAGCRACAQELARWQAAQEALSSLGPVKSPAGLALRLRRAIADERERHDSRLFARIAQSWQNAVRPMLLQVSAGFAGSVALFGVIALLLGAAAAPREVQANDEPLGALTAPHLLYSTATADSILTGADNPIIVEASVDERGRVYDYKIVSGAADFAVRSQVANQLLSSIFQPASAFGVPVRGRVVVTFAGISVHP